MDVQDRITALREDYARTGENVTHLTDMELLAHELDRVQAESRRHHNAHQALLQDRTEHDRAVRTAARREAAEDRMAWVGMYLRHLVTQSAGPINEVINRAVELPDGRVSAEQTQALKTAAERAIWRLSGLVGHDTRKLDEARRTDQQISLVEKQRAEILRLRDVIGAQAARLHDERCEKPFSQNGLRCECLGCEMLRDMDDVGVAA